MLALNLVLALVLALLLVLVLVLVLVQVLVLALVPTLQLVLLGHLAFRRFDAGALERVGGPRGPRVRASRSATRALAGPGLRGP